MSGYFFMVKCRYNAGDKRNSRPEAMMRKILLAIVFVLSCCPAFAQNMEQLLGQAAQVYTGSDGSAQGLVGGFSVWGLVGGFMFGMIGTGAFIYGKKEAKAKPMLIGITLMVFPYFVRGTPLLYVIGLVLCAALYFL